MFRPASLWMSCLLLFCGMCVWSSAQAPSTGVASARGVVKVARIVGEAYVVDTSTSLKTRLSPSSLVVDGQVVETAAKSSVVLVFSNGAVVNLRADSRLEVAEFRQALFTKSLNVGQATNEPSSSNTRLMLRKGEIISQVKKLNREAGSSFTVETPVGAAGIRGTAFSLLYDRRGSVARFALTMAEGLIRFIPLRGRSVDVPAGKALAFDAAIDAATGRVLSVPETPAPADVAPADAAGLQSALSEAMAAAASIQFAPASGTGGQFSVGTATSTSDTTTPTTETAAAAGDATGTTEPTSSAIASPPPTPPAERTTPGDGM